MKCNLPASNFNDFVVPRVPYILNEMVDKEHGSHGRSKILTSQI
jgi:hypothetical protein